MARYDIPFSEVTQFTKTWTDFASIHLEEQSITFTNEYLHPEMPEDLRTILPRTMMDKELAAGDLNAREHVNFDPVVDRFWSCIWQFLQKRSLQKDEWESRPRVVAWKDEIHFW